MRSTKHLLVACVVAFALPPLGCSLAVPFEECQSDADCTPFAAAGETLTCQANVCQVESTTPTGNLVVSGTITADTEWRSDRVVELRGIVYVEAGRTLTIRPGTTVVGATGAALVIERGATIDARGTVTEPIVFTSAKPKGQRAPGDWSGLVLLGSAPTGAVTGLTLKAAASQGHAAEFGGSEPDSSCGSLGHVRVEYAGISGDDANEHPGLSFAGCGSGTQVDFVQVHRAVDDGIVIYGGTVKLRHILVTLAARVGLEYTYGWSGQAQYLAIHQGDIGLTGLEVDLSGLTPTQQPEVYARIWNFSILASGNNASQVAIEFSNGGRGHFDNGIVLGQRFHAVEVFDDTTADNCEAGLVKVQHSLFFDIGVGGDDYFPSAEEETELEAGDGRDDDGGFDEDAFFRHADRANAFGTDPTIANAYSDTLVGWSPSTAPSGIAVNPPSAFESGAKYLGAFQPNTAPWTAGWTTSDAN